MTPPDAPNDPSLPQSSSQNTQDGSSSNAVTNVTKNGEAIANSKASASEPYIPPIPQKSQSHFAFQKNSITITKMNQAASWVAIVAIALMVVGLILNSVWLGFSGAVVALLVSIRVIFPPLQKLIEESISPQERALIVAGICGIVAVLGLLKFIGVYRRLIQWGKTIPWESVGSLAEWTGAVGQIFIAVLAVYIAWRQYVIGRDLTIQQNVITQQQTIDSYFQGISELALDDEGLLEDWPQERAFCEGRTAAILGSVDAAGKAKVLRYLSQSRLLTPLKRDRHLGRPILDGNGSYQEDRNYGVRVIDLNVMLAGADMTGTDLRWTELSEAYLVRANLSNCDLVKANLARAILYQASLAGADLKGTRFHYGKAETASPRSRTAPPDYRTGAQTGAVVEETDFTNVQRLSEDQRYYCCAWGGEATRSTIPGGCEGIPNKLGR